MIRPLGVDITHRVGTVQWRTARLAGVSFAFIKATHGSDIVDPRFNEYWRGAADAGVLRAAYHCFQPHQDPHAQARWFTRHAPPGELPPAVVLDLEGDLPSDALECLRIFLQEFAALTGQVPLLQVDLAKRIPSVVRGITRWTLAALDYGDLERVSWAGDYPLWVVSYFTRSPDTPYPWSPLKWMFWRFSQRGDTGKYGAQSQYINLNLFNGSLERLKGCKRWMKTLHS